MARRIILVGGGNVKRVASTEGEGSLDPPRASRTSGGPVKNSARVDGSCARIMVLQRSQQPRGTSLRAVRGDNHTPSDLTTAEVSPNTTPRRKRSHVMSAQTFRDSIAAAIWLK